MFELYSSPVAYPYCHGQGHGHGHCHGHGGAPVDLHPTFSITAAKSPAASVSAAFFCPDATAVSNSLDDAELDDGTTRGGLLSNHRLDPGATSLPAAAALSAGPYELNSNVPFGFFLPPIELEGGLARAGASKAGLDQAATSHGALDVASEPTIGVEATIRSGSAGSGSRSTPTSASNDITAPAVGFEAATINNTPDTATTVAVKTVGKRKLSHAAPERLPYSPSFLLASSRLGSRRHDQPTASPAASRGLWGKRYLHQRAHPTSKAHSPSCPTIYGLASTVQPKMENPDHHQDPHGMAAQQAAAQNYQPEKPNYLVGDKTPSDVITQEYAKADQTYIGKTLALPRNYSHYRPVAGDGNCGWRAIGFAYFEKLIETGDAQRIAREAERLAAEGTKLSEIGGYTYFEDFAEPLLETLEEIGRNAGNPSQARTLLQQRWNDEDTTASMIYYMRLLAATFLKADSESYDPFIADSGGVHGYCSQAIELPNREIEHLGIVALVGVLLKPNNFVLEIAYLDRSPGDQVTTYRLPNEANEQHELEPASVIYLLYRPDHYDILYRERVAPQPNLTDLDVLRVSRLSDNAGITSAPIDINAFASGNFQALSMIPGFGGPGLGMSPSPVGDSYSSAAQQSSWFGLPESTPTPPQPQVVAPLQVPNPSLSPHPPSGPRAPPQGNSAQAPLMHRQSPECSIRFSLQQLEYDGAKSDCPEPFQVTTNTFKNSVWNRAHFGNPDFHPEEWSPEDENVDGRMGSKRRGSRRE